MYPTLKTADFLKFILYKFSNASSILVSSFRIIWIKCNQNFVKCSERTPLPYFTLL